LDEDGFLQRKAVENFLRLAQDHIELTRAAAVQAVADVTEMERVKFVMKGGVIVRNDLGSAAAP
jgi:hypothetical protein